MKNLDKESLADWVAYYADGGELPDEVITELLDIATNKFEEVRS